MEKTKPFIWKNIITRFGYPYVLVVENGSNFDRLFIQAFCAEHKIKNFYSTPSYSQSNGLAENFNKTILDGIKKRLEEAKGRWVKELFEPLLGQ